MGPGPDDRGLRVARAGARRSVVAEPESASGRRRISPVRLATIITPDGLRLHVRGHDGGYVDVAQATGDARLSELSGVLARGREALELARRAAEHEGREVAEADFGPAVPSPNRILCLGVNYLEHALEGGRPPTTWPETFVRGADSVAAPY